VFLLRTAPVRRSRMKRSLYLSLEHLEIRLAPAGSSSPVGYTPPQIRAAYGINQITFGGTQGDGTGQTISVIAAYSNPALVDSTAATFKTSDLANFDQEFHLRDPAVFTILNEFGTDIGSSTTLPQPATDPTGAWEDREALDVEWAHAIAPGASIVLIECNSDSAADLLTGVATAASLSGVSVVMMNQSSGQAPSLPLADLAFTAPSGHQGITFVAPTGDAGSPGWSAAYSRNALAVGGTTLTLNTVDLPSPYTSELAWSGSGGGGSALETEPAYQQGVQSTGFRTVPDVSFDADPSTGVSVFDSYNNGFVAPWVQAGGTSLAAVGWAGLVAIADQGRVAAGGATLDGATQTLPALYTVSTADFHDVTGGSNGGFTAGPGYDLVSGLGTPQANVLESDLASYKLGGQLVISSQPPASIQAGTPFGFTVTALDRFGNVETSFNGSVTVSFGTNPSGGPLRGSLFATASHGVAVFNALAIDTAATGYTLEASGLGTTAATTAFINVIPGPAANLAVTSPPASGDAVAINSSFGLTVTAEDIFGNPATSYGGSVTVALGNNPAGGALAGTTTVTAIQGVAAFVDLAIDVASTDYTLQVFGSGLASATTGTLHVTPPATQIVVIEQPPSSVIAGDSFGLTIWAEDASDDLVPSYFGDVSVALANGPDGSNLSGRLIVTAQGGVATFTGLSLNESGIDTFLVTSSPLASATTAALSVTPGPVAQLVVTTPPPLTTTAGVAFGLAVSAEDTYGNVETSFYGNITIGLVASTVALSGALTATASQGVATFEGLVLDAAGNGYNLQATDGTLTATTSAMSVTPAAATRLVVTAPPPATLTAGSSFGLTVSAEDPFGNLATSFDDNVSVGLASGPSGSALSGTTNVVAQQGIASFSGLALDTIGTDFTFQVESGTLSVTIDNGMSVTPGPATKLAVTTEPPGSSTAGSSFGLTVSIEDAFGNVSTTYSGSVTVGLVAATAGVVLGGTTAVPAVNGVAAFTGLTINTAGAGYKLQATGSGVTTATTSAFNVTAGTASHLAVMSQPPATVAAGSGFGMVVWAEDAFGNLATSFGGSVSVTQATGPSGGALGGTTTVPASAGVARFTGLVLSTPGSGYTLQVKSAGLISTTTGAISVTPTATQLRITSPELSSVVAGTGFGLQVSVADAFGNLVPSFSGNVTIGLATNPGGGELGGTLTAVAVNGVANFSGLSINVAGTGYTLQATSSGLTTATTSAFVVAPGAVPHLAIFTGLSPITTGAAFVITVDAENSAGAPVTNFSGNVTLTLAGNPGGATLGGNLTLPATDGQVTFYGLSLNRAGSGYTILATSNGYVAAATPALAVVDPPATQIFVTTQPPASAVVNQAFGLTVEIVDASGHRASGFNGTVMVSLAGRPGAGKLQGTLAVTAQAGMATISGLTLTKVAKGDKLRLTIAGLPSASTRAFSVRPAPRRAPLAVHTNAPRAKITRVAAGPR
jgi:hypothetical protein